MTDTESIKTNAAKVLARVALVIALPFLAIAKLLVLPLEKPVDLSAESPAALAGQGAAALRAGDSARAIGLLSELVARQPRHGGNQALLALAWQMRGETDTQALDLAQAGYDLAGRAEPGQYWPAAMAGRVAFDQGKYDQAADHFARAA